ncbi:MAG: hypothetical protein ABI383_16190 [Acidobacteriaceae bacterium]
MRAKPVYLICFALHFSLILLASSRDLFSVLSEGGNLFPASFIQSWNRLEDCTSAALGQRLFKANPLRQLLTVYTHSAGIEAGYGFFAPNVPNSYKLVFEIHHPDGELEYQLPEVRGAAAGLRLISLYDNIGRITYEPLRELTLRMLAYSVWREHPDATLIRAVFGTVTIPAIPDSLRGQKESYDLICSYDFAPAPSESRLPK